MDPWETLGGPLEDPWRILGGSSEYPWRTLGGPVWGGWPWEELWNPAPTSIRAAKVCIHVPRPKSEACVHVETGEVCIHVPGPQNEVGLQVQIAKVCIHVPWPETEVCTNVQNPQRCVYTHLRPKTRYVYKCRSLCCRQHLTKYPSRHTDFEAEGTAYRVAASEQHVSRRGFVENAFKADADDQKPHLDTWILIGIPA